MTIRLPQVANIKRVFRSATSNQLTTGRAWYADAHAGRRESRPRPP